jgi:hypothetical protein
VAASSRHGQVSLVALTRSSCSACRTGVAGDRDRPPSYLAGAPAVFHEFALAVIAVNAGLLARQAVMSPASALFGPGTALAIVVILLIVVPGEYWVWKTWSPSRVRATDRRLWRATHTHNANDPRLAASVRKSRLLRRRGRGLQTSSARGMVNGRRPEGSGATLVNRMLDRSRRRRRPVRSLRLQGAVVGHNQRPARERVGCHRPGDHRDRRCGGFSPALPIRSGVQALHRARARPEPP